MLRTTAIEANALPSDWLERIQQHLIVAGYATQLEGRTLHVYPSVGDWEVLKQGEFYRSWGWQVSRLYLAPGRSAILVNDHQYVWDRTCKKRVSDTATIASLPKKGITPSALRRHIAIIVKLLKEAGIGETKTLKVNVVDIDQNRTQAWVRGYGCDVWSSPLSSFYLAHGFDTWPDGMTVTMTGIDEVSMESLCSVKSSLDQEMHKRRGSVLSTVHDLHSIKRRLQILTSSSGVVEGNHLLLIVMPSKHTKPTPEFAQLLRLMSEAQLRHKRMYLDDPLTYSLPDMLPSMVNQVGGKSHVIKLGDEYSDYWYVGIDLTHRSNKHESRIAVSLVDAAGRLVNVWTASHPRDETLHKGVLHSLLREVKMATGQHQPKCLLYRDGKMFEKDSPVEHIDVLGGNVTVVEYRKRGGPILINDDENERFSRHPLAGTIEGTDTLYLRINTGLSSSRAVRIVMKDEFNRLQLGMDDLATITTALVVAPGLGLRLRRHPAPIYWADGVIGNSSSDLRFIGQAVKHVDLSNT